ncbi:MAG: peptidyl-prolyl cis-trans isomerase [Sphingomonadales bacterium]|jgi:peptidyl-prolyl cis-trans isomerase A (cyclophilin A)|nr:peptidyl-prolyl cis-trans isomerase [Sphingomonadales bacterium]
MNYPLAILAPLLLAVAGCGGSPAADPATANVEGPAPDARSTPLPDLVRVRLDTDAGPILIALDVKHAPVTAANFVRYVDAKKFDGTYFYRAARTKGAPGRGFVQGGIRHSARRAFPPITHEPTSATGLKHVDGTVSMARAAPVGAMGDFFIIVGGAMPDMDSKPGAPGFAAFGRVERGLDVVRYILAAPTVADGGRGPMRGQMIEKPVRILRASR